jgi:hypothetical protein
MNELLEDIQTYLNAERDSSAAAQEYEKLLEAFYQIPSYVERFKKAEEEQ